MKANIIISMNHQRRKEWTKMVDSCVKEYNEEKIESIELWHSHTNTNVLSNMIQFKMIN